MGKSVKTSTPATRALKSGNIPFRPHPYEYKKDGGTRWAAEALEVDEHAVIKTLVMIPKNGTPFIILMHGNRSVSTKNMARSLNVKSVVPCDPKTAEKHTGFQVGGISPFGTRNRLKVYMESSIADLNRIFINGGKRGLLLEMSPGDLIRFLEPMEVSVAI